MKRKILGLSLCAFLLTGLVACGKEDVENASSGKETESTSGIEEIESTSSDKEVESTSGIEEVESTSEIEEVENVNKYVYNEDFKLFKEFYSRFYDEHRDFITDKGEVYDCFPKIIINDNKAIMAIVDIIEEGKLLDLYLFETNGEEVIEKAKLKDISTYEFYGIDVTSVGDNIFITCSRDGKYLAYKVIDNNFVEIFNVNDDDVGPVDALRGYEFKTDLGKNGTGGSFLLWEKYHVWRLLYSRSRFFNGTDFETLIDNMINVGVRDNADITFCYYDSYEKKYNDKPYPTQVWDDSRRTNFEYVYYWEDGIYYELYRDGTAWVYKTDNGYEDAKIPEKVNGYKVDLAAWQEMLNKKDYETGRLLCRSLIDDRWLSGRYNVEVLVEIKTGIEPSTNAIVFSGKCDVKHKSYIIENFMEDFSDDNIRINNPNQFVDGSGIIPESYYVLIRWSSTDGLDYQGFTATYVSSSGRTLEEIKNDKEGDGIFKIYEEE